MDSWYEVIPCTGWPAPHGVLLTGTWLDRHELSLIRIYTVLSRWEAQPINEKKPTCCRHLFNIVCNSCDVRNLWEIHHDAKFVVAVGTNTCRYENLRCQQWRQTCPQNKFLVKGRVFTHICRGCCTGTRTTVLPQCQWSYTESCVEDKAVSNHNKHPRSANWWKMVINSWHSTYSANVYWHVFMMMSGHRNTFRVTHPLWGVSIGHRWIPIKRGQ